MSRSINAFNSQGNLNISLDQFREMVNLKSGKNKGYVRLVLDDKGKVGIGKVGNQVDLFISLRENVSAENNRRVRNMFSQALTNSLCNATPDQKKALEALAKGLGVNQTQVSDKPLSRREVRNAFEQYDRIMNDSTGRRDQVKRMFDEKLLLSGFLKPGEERCFTGTSKEDKDKAEAIRAAFVAKYMSGEKVAKEFNESMILLGKVGQDYQNKDLDSREYSDWKKAEGDKIKAEKWKTLKKAGDDFYTGAGEKADVKGAHTFRPMEVSEANFRTDYLQFQENMQQAVMRCKLEGGLRAGIREGQIFSGGKGEQYKAELRQYLSDRLTKMGVKPNAGFGQDAGTNGIILDRFVNVVVEALVKKAHVDFSNLPVESTDALGTEEDRMDDILDLQGIVDQAKEYFDAVAAHFNPQSNGGEFAGIAEGAQQMAMKGIAGQHLKQELEAANFTEQEIEKMLKDFTTGVIPGVQDEQKLNKLTVDFIARKYAVVVREQQSQPDEADRLISEADKNAQRIAVAGKLVAGEKLYVGGKRIENPNEAVSTFVEKVLDSFAEIVQTEKGLLRSNEAYVDISENYLPQVINGKIANALEADRNKVVDLKMSEADRDALRGELGGVLKYYMQSQDRERKLGESFQKTLTKQVNRLVKEGKISEENGRSLLAKWPMTAHACVRKEVGKLLRDLKVNAGEEMDALNDKALRKAVENGLKIAQVALQDELVGTIAFEKIQGLGGLSEDAKRVFSSNTGDLVSNTLKELALAWQGADKLDFDELRLTAAVQTRLDALRLAALKDLLKGGTLNLKKEDVESAAAKLREDLTNEATKIIDRVVTLRKGAAEAVKARIAEGLTDVLRAGQTGVVPTAYGKEVSDDDLAALVKDLTDRIFTESKEIFNTSFDSYYVAPMELKGKEVNACLVGQICGPGRKDNAYAKFKEICDQSAETLRNWLQSTEKNPSGLDSAKNSCLNHAAFVWNENHSKGTAPVNRPPEKLETDKETRQRLVAALSPETLPPAEGQKEDIVFAQVPEKSNVKLVEMAVKTVRTNVENHALLYTEKRRELGPNEMGDARPLKDEFDARLRSELEQEHLRLAKQYVELQKTNVEGFAKVATKYAALQENALREVMHETLIAAITGGDPKLLKPKYLQAFFEHNLDQRREMIVGWKVDEFNQYVIDYEKAEKNLAPAKDVLMTAIEDQMKTLPDDVQEHIRQTVQKEAEGKLTYWLARNPSKFIDGDGFEQTKTQLVKTAEELVKVLVSRNVKDPDQYGWIQSEAQLSGENEQEEKVLKEAIKTFAEKEDPAENVNRLNAIFDAYFPAVMSYNKVEQSAGLEKVDELYKAFAQLVHASCAPQVDQLRIAEYNQISLPMAHLLFKEWLNGFDQLVDDPSRPFWQPVEESNYSIRDQAIGLFDERYKEIAEAIHDERQGAKEEPLLSANFILKIVSLYATKGVSVAMDAFLQKKAEMSFQNVVRRESKLVKLTDVEKAEQGEDALQTCLEANCAELDKLYKEVCQETHLQMLNEGTIDTIETFARMSEIIETRFQENLANQLDSFVAQCEKRVELAAQFNQYAEKARERIVALIASLQAKLGADQVVENQTGVFNSLAESLRNDLDEQLKLALSRMRESIQNLSVPWDDVERILTSRIDFVLTDLSKSTCTNELAKPFQTLVSDVREKIAASSRQTTIEKAYKTVSKAREDRTLQQIDKEKFEAEFGQRYDELRKKCNFDPAFKFDFSHVNSDFERMEAREAVLKQRGAEFEAALKTELKKWVGL